MADWKQFSILGITWVDGDKALTLIDGLDGVVNILNIKSLVSNEAAFPNRQEIVGTFQNIKGDRAVGNLGGSCKLIDGQPGDAIDQHMILVAPVELVVFLIVLVGSRVNAQSAILIRFGLVFLPEPVFSERLGVVVRSVGGYRR